MAGRSAVDFYVAASIGTFDDAGSVNAVGIKFPLTAEPVVRYRDPVIDDDLNQTARTTFFGESTGTLMHRQGAFSFSMKATTVALMFWSYWASHGNAAATLSSAFGTGTAAKRMNWVGDIQLTSGIGHKSMVLEFIGDDANRQQRMYNCIVESVTISGSRGTPITIQVSGRFGGNGAGSITPGSATTLDDSGPLFFTPNLWLNTSDTSSVGPATNLFDTAPTYTALESNTRFGTSSGETIDSAYGNHLMSFSLNHGIAVDPERSLRAGGLSYVELDSDWYVTGQSCTLSLTFKGGDSLVDDLADEYLSNPPTARPWELQFISNSAFDGNNDSYPGYACTFPKMRPVPGSFREEADDVSGHKLYTVDYIPLFTSTSVKAIYHTAAIQAAWSAALGS